MKLNKKMQSAGTVAGSVKCVALSFFLRSLGFLGLKRILGSLLTWFTSSKISPKFLFGCLAGRNQDRLDFALEVQIQ